MSPFTVLALAIAVCNGKASLIRIKKFYLRTGIPPGGRLLDPDQGETCRPLCVTLTAFINLRRLHQYSDYHFETIGPDGRWIA